ncbi:MAG: hypothetical protein JO360_06180 [Acidobacteria bacterium]|nr:hypothetical protein [Acidobacteriota bacterium]
MPVWLMCLALLCLTSCDSYTNTTVGSKSAANEAAAIGALRTIASAQAKYQATHDTGEFGTFEDLVKEGMLDVRFSGAQPVVGGYVFNMTAFPRNNAGGPNPSYAVTADPQGGVAAAATGNRYFYLDSTGVIHFNKKQTATASDPPLGN